MDIYKDLQVTEQNCALFALAVREYMQWSPRFYGFENPHPFYVQEEQGKRGIEFVCAVPSRDLYFHGNVNGNTARITAVTWNGKTEEVESFSFSPDETALGELLIERKFWRNPTLSDALRERIFLLAIQRVFGLPLWQGVVQVGSLVQKINTPMISAGRMRYKTDPLMLEGTVSFSFNYDKPNDDTIRVSFSTVLIRGRRQPVKGYSFTPAEIAKLSLDRVVVEGWYAQIGKWFGAVA